MKRALEKDTLEQSLKLLGGLLDQRSDVHPISLVVCGGSALIITGLISRATRDVDVLASLSANGTISELTALPDWLREAAAETGATLNLPDGWLNLGPRSLVNPLLENQGLPRGLAERLLGRAFGRHLTLYFVSRIDQIYFKLPAAADQGGPSRHLDDLMALAPSAEELESACRWATTAVDPSPAFAETVRQMVSSMGFSHVASRI